MSAINVRLMHISDVHFGRSYVESHVAAAEEYAAKAMAGDGQLDAIIVSGDLSQRARAHEFAAAANFLARLEAIAPTLVVAGNHDSEWWNAPFGYGSYGRVHETWQRVIGRPLEPTLRVAGVSIIGMNSAAGVMPWTLTWNPRDLRIKGGLTRAQIEYAAVRMNESPTGDFRVLVLHHNVLRGRLSNRWGLARPLATLDAIAAMGVNVVCTGHDHEERAELAERPTGSVVVSAANTLSNRARGKRVASFNVIVANEQEVTVGIWHFDQSTRSFALQRGITAPRARY